MGGKDLVLEKAEQESMVSLIERDHANVSFCSNHILGTAPPSFGGWSSAKRPRDLQRFGLAPCALAPPMRRWRGNHAVPLDGRELAQTRAAATCRFRGCSVRAGSHLLCPPRRHAPAGVRPGSHAAEPSALAPPSPSRCSCTRSVSVRREPSGRAWPPSSPSSPPMRCPGWGLQRSRRLSASKPLRPHWRSRGITASPHPAGGGEPASAATATCWRTKCRDVAISTRTKAPEGLESCRRGGAS